MKFKFKNYLKILSVVAIVIIAAVLYLRRSAPAVAAWWDTNYLYRQVVAITNAGSEQTDYQVQITVDTSTLVSASKMQSDCDDMRFTEADGTELNYWIEPGTCNNASTKVWVKVGTISAGGVDIYMYYGNTAAAAASNLNNVFIRDISDVHAAWTLDEQSGTRADSSGDGNTLADNNTVTYNPGQYSNAAQFTKTSSEYLSKTDGASLSTGDINFTWTAWIYMDTKPTGADDDYILSKMGGAASNNEYAIHYAGSTTDRLDFFYQGADGGWVTARANNYGSPATGQWIFVVGWHDTTDDLAGIQVNNGTANTQATGASHPADGGAAFNLGAYTGGYSHFNGRIDQVKFYKKILSAEEKTDLYNTGYIGYFTSNYANHELLRKYVSADAPSAGAPATEERGPVRLYFRLDEGTGTTIHDSSPSGITATLNGVVDNPTWQTEDMCVAGKCLYFEGSNASASATMALSGVEGVSFWAKPASSSGTIPFISLSNGTGTLAVTSSNLTVSAPGFTSPTIYVNGRQGSTLSANVWNHIEVTTATAFTVTNPVLGKVHNVFFKGFLDEIKFYNYARTADQVKLDYNRGGVVETQNLASLHNGLVGYWKMDESSGNAADSSGNGVTLTNNGTLTYAVAKFGNGASATVNTKYLSTTTALSGIKTVAFWINPVATTTYPIDLNGTQTITATTGTISANNFTGPTIYVNGAASSTLVAGSWQHVVVTTNTGFDSGTMIIGLVGTNTMNGTIDEVRIYNQVLTPSEVEGLYNFAPSPVRYYKFDENGGATVTDWGTGQSNGTWVGTGNHWISGKFGAAGKFNGTDDQVSLGNIELLEPTTNFTISTWVYPTTFNATNEIFAEGKSDTTVQAFRFSLNSTGVVSISFINDADAPGFSATGGTAPLNQWSYVTVTKDGANVNVCVNGVCTATALTLTGTFTFDRTNIGAISRTTIVEYFTGRIDDLKIYNYARTQAQIMADMETGGSRPNLTPVGYWKFDEGQGIVANDSSGYGNTGSLSGPVWNPDGKFGRALQFDGSNDVVTVANSLSTQTVSFWISPVTTTQPLITLASGKSISVSSGSVAATGFTSPSYFVNGKSGAAGIAANQWNHVVVMDTAAIVANAIVIGQATTYFNGLIDEVKVYNYALTTDEIKTEYNHSFMLQLGSVGVASQSASAQYCVPGGADTCTPPVAEYNFEEGSGINVLDTSGNNLTNVYSGTGSCWVVGKIGQACNFNGSDNITAIDDNSLLEPANDMTVEAWVYLTALPSVRAENAAIVFKEHNDTPWFSYVFSIDNVSGDNQLNFVWANSTPTTSRIRQSYTFALNRWYHLVGQRSGATLKLYIDGVLQPATADVAPSGTIFNSVSHFHIGAGSSSSDRLAGRIDGLKIFSYARSAAQIAWDYNKGGPTARYKMDECSGTTLYDSGSGTNSATLSIGTAGPDQIAAGTCTDSLSTSAWYNGRTGKFNSSVNFDGADDKATVTTGLNDIQSVSFWAKPASSSGTIPFIALATAPAINVTSSNLVVSATGWTSPTIYVNGRQGSTLSSGQWNHVVVTSATSNSANAIILGYISPTYFKGQLDEAKFFNYQLTATQVRNDYNQAAAVRFGP